MSPSLLDRLNPLDDLTTELMEATVSRQLFRFPIHHHTRAGTAKLILESNSFRFMSAIDHIGDPGETKLGMDIGYSCLKNFKESSNELKSEFYRKFAPTLNTALDTKLFFGICCFTEERMGARHWYDYADGHRGVQIGLGHCEIEQLPSSKVFDLSMHYCPAATRAIFDKLITELDRVLSDPDVIKTAVDSRSKNALLHKASVLLGQSFIMHALQLKKPCFKWEKEVRLLLVANLHVEKSNPDPFPVERVEPDERGAKFVRLKMWPNLEQKAAVQRIVIGLDAPPNTESELRSALAKVGNNDANVTRAFWSNRPLLFLLNIGFWIRKSLRTLFARAKSVVPPVPPGLR